MHPEDAKTLGLTEGDTVACASRHGEVMTVVEFDDGMRRGSVSLPHGYGARFQDSPPIGPELNRLISGQDCDPFSRTPYQKYIPVRLRKLADVSAA